MVYKEEVYNWFHSLTGRSRIDFMCGLLLKCGPFELRYLGACIEDLARKEYNNLREDENNANKAAHVRQLNNIFDPCIRSKLTLSLALLYSTNRECSDIVYRTLESQLAAHLEPNLSNILSDDQIYEEFLLLLTMTVHHPAFAFRQKHDLKCYLDKLESLQRMQRQSCCKASSYSNMAEPEEEDEEIPQVHQSNQTIPVAAPSSPVIVNGEPGQQPVYIKDIEVKDFKRRSSDHRHEYIFQITWSNGVVNTVGKTHGDLFAFQLRVPHLNQLQEGGPHQTDCNMPYLPAKLAPKEVEKQVKDYARQVVALPQHILQSEEILNFFQYQESSTPQSMMPQPARVSTPSSSSNTVLNNPKPQDTSANIVAKAVIHKVSTTTTTNRPMYTQGIPNQPLAISPLPSPLSSPHISPSVSPSSSTSSSRQQMHTGYVGVQEWLKGLRLHKYSNHFQDLTFKQVLQLTAEDLDKWQGFTDGAKRKLLNHIEQLRLYAKGVNGVNEHAIWTKAMSLISPTQNKSYNSISHFSLSPPQPPVQNLFTTSSYIQTSTNPVEYSSSDCSSTPSSPRESSDENEKDSEASESSAFSIPESNVSSRGERSVQGHISNMLTSSSTRSQSMQDLPARSRQLNISTSSHPSVMPTYSNVVKSRSMERIGSQDSKQQIPATTQSHCHSTPSSPASEVSLRHLNQQTPPMPLHQLPAGDGHSRQYTQANVTSINATSPLRSSAMVFTPKQLASSPSGVNNQSEVSTCTTSVVSSSQHVVKSVGSTASTMTTYKTSVAYVPNLTTNAMSTVTTTVATLPPLITTPAVPPIKPLPPPTPENVISSSAIPAIPVAVPLTLNVCVTTTAPAKVEAIYTTAKTFMTGALTNVTYTTASPRATNEGAGANILQPQGPMVVPNVGHNPGVSVHNTSVSVHNPGVSAHNPGMSAHNPGVSAHNPGVSAHNPGVSVHATSVSAQPSNMYSSAEHNVTSHNNLPPNYGNGGNQGNSYLSNHVVSFPNSGSNFGGNRGPAVNLNNSGSNTNVCSSANSMVCTSCGSPCATNNPLNNNSAAAFQFPPNPGYSATHIPNAALPHANFPGFLSANINGLINPGIPGTHRYPPRMPPSPFPNGIGDFWFGGGNLGVLPQGLPLQLGLYHQHPGTLHHIAAHKKVTCYNCGGAGHRGHDCKESTMEAVQSKFNLKYTPVTESEPE